MPAEPCEHAGIIRRLHTSLLLVNDLDLLALQEQYGGIDSTEHEGVQTVIALALELRAVERALGDMHRGRRPGRTRRERFRPR